MHTLTHTHEQYVGMRCHVSDVLFAWIPTQVCIPLARCIAYSIVPSSRSCGCEWNVFNIQDSDGKTFGCFPTPYTIWHWQVFGIASPKWNVVQTTLHYHRSVKKLMSLFFVVYLFPFCFLSHSTPTLCTFIAYGPMEHDEKRSMKINWMEANRRCSLCVDHCRFESSNNGMCGKYIDDNSFSGAYHRNEILTISIKSILAKYSYFMNLLVGDARRSSTLTTVCVNSYCQ